MKPTKLLASFLLFSICLFSLAVNPVFGQLKIGYVNSNKILESFKDAIDVRKQLQELNAQWEQEARDMQKEIQTLQEQVESQSLLLSEERKAAKQQEIQNLYIKYQQFLQEKWNPQGGEAVKKEVELIQPVYDKINKAIQKIGEAGGYTYIFDTVAANILYAAKDQPDLTGQLLDELNKGLPKTDAQAKQGK
ncbi:MAG: OmpH family outer membrane protein [bacterium]